MDSERNRPVEHQNEPGTKPSPESRSIAATFRQAVQAGLSPQQVADRVFDAIRDDQFYILTDSEYNADIQGRLAGIQQHLGSV
jgi:hypothetical protein